MKRLAVKVERERLLLSVLPALSEQIVAYARDHGRVTMGDIIITTGASRNTLKEHFRDLVARNQLAQHGTGRGTWYRLP